MAGRRDDSVPDPVAASSARSVAPVHSSGSRRGVGPAAGALLVAGVVVALVVTVVVFSADDPRLLRLALVTVCWAFLVVAFLAAGRRAEQVAARHREAELRRDFDLQVEREVAARLDHHLQLESQRRRDAEQGMRDDLAQLRAELGSLTQLRAELTGQRTGELLVERTVLRAQSVRSPGEHGGDDGRTVDGGRWPDPWAEARGTSLPVVAHPAAGTAATSLVESTRPLERIGDTRPAAGPLAPEPETASEGDDATAAGPPITGSQPSERADGHDAGTAGRPDLSVPGAPRRHRRAAEPDDELAVVPVPAVPVVVEVPEPRQPLAGSPAGSPAGPPAESPWVAEELPPDEPSWALDPLPTPAAEDIPARAPDQPAGQRGGSPSPTSEDAPAAERGEDAGHARLAEILAENSAGAASGGRRRRRYRDEEGGEPADDVLARVLGRPVSPSAR